MGNTSRCLYYRYFYKPKSTHHSLVTSLSIAGTACLINAFRCGRVHCYFTGPFYLLMAVLSLLYGIGVLQFGQFGWAWIGGTVVIVGPILSRVPEQIYGKYITGQ
jgi:hypothetical protein